MASILFSLVLSLVLSSPISSLTFDSLSKGSSLSVETTDLLVSPNGIFSAGFFAVGDNAYCFAIWFSKPSCGNNCTVVWMANRDKPVNGRRSKLSLLQNGDLILTDAGQVNVWATNTVSQGPTVQLLLHDSGNLVLQNSDGVVKLWQSFDSPTDTLLAEQPLTRNTKLVSSRSQSNYSSGVYKFFFDNDNVIRLLFDGPAVSSIYWPDPGLVSWDAGRTTYNSSRIAVLDSLGKFTSTDALTFLSSDYGAKIHRRLKIDFDGNLRVYSREEETGTWYVSWLAREQPCMVHGLCGPNAVCRYTPSTPSGRNCSCIPGYKMKNHSDWSFGCEPEFNVSCGNIDQVGFLKLSRVVFYGYDYSYFTNYTFEMCENYCLQLCNCKGFEYKFTNSLTSSNGVFCLIKTQLLNGYHMPSFEGDQYVKLPKTTIFSYKESPKEYSLNCSNEVPIQLDRAYARSHENESLYFVLWFACAFGGTEILVIFLMWVFLIRTHQNTSAATQSSLQAATGFKRFTYAELKKATKGFSEQIGRGSGGIVYKGVLSDQRVAAIKQINEANQGEAEFLAEVSTIGRLNQMNLIEMWGYCAEGKHRLLVYEYMKHGSLAENLSSRALDWEKRFEIAVGTAKGLAYLHEECLEWVLHCDVKPQNILLDSSYQPKVSDFGLSRLLSRVKLDNSSFSRIRGTRGYMAPEWVYKLPITSKVDVYSYGIVVLEMVTGKSPAIGVQAMDDGGEIEYRRLVTWVREKMNGATTMASWVEEIIDPILGNNYDIGKMEILVAVALQCVEENRDARPTMSQVVDVLLRHENDE